MPSPSTPFTAWHEAQHYPALMRISRARDWLCYTDSLTLLLAHTTQQQAQLLIAHEDDGFPQAEECLILQQPEDKIARIREGGWYHLGVLWISTRVVIPQPTLEAAGDLLRHLDQRSIGTALLFHNPKVIVGRLEFRPIVVQNATDPTLVSTTHHQSDTLWARRRLFDIEGNPLLIQEIFLPEIFEQAPCFPP